MDKSSFNPDTRYTIAWQDPHGRVQPAIIYVYRVHEKFMIARMTGGDGLLRKIAYADVHKIVSADAVAARDRTYLPAALLDEKAWGGRTVMQHYAGSPQRGK